MTNRPRVVLVNRCIILNKESEVLVIKRSDNDSNEPGLWEFPGGKLEEGQYLEEALEREVMEEVGLSIQVKSRIACVFSDFIKLGKYKGMPYVVIVGIGQTNNNEVNLSEEHDDYKWVDPNDLPNLEFRNHVKESLESIKEFKKNG